MSSVFVISAIALVALALAFVLPLLWRDDRRSALALLLVVPLSTAGLYALFGTPDALDPDNRTMPTDIAEAAAQLERRLERDPDRLDGWVLLGRARQELGRRALTAGDGDAATVNFEAAAKAFRAAVELAPDEVDLMVETAEAISFANPELSFSAEAVALLDRALAQNPVHERALWFRGIAALQSGDAATAVQRWETLLPLVDEATATALRTQIARAREQADMPPMDPALAGPADAAAPAEAAPGTPGTLTITIEADPTAVAALPPEAVLFIFARDAEAGGPPVAARRLPAARLPLTLTLSDADRLMPTATLSATPRVEVSARFARSGTLTPDAGDLVATPIVVATANAAPLSLRLLPGAAPGEAPSATAGAPNTGT